MYSNCCGEEPSYLNDELCGGCQEWASFEEALEDENPELTSEELRELMKIYKN